MSDKRGDKEKERGGKTSTKNEVLKVLKRTDLFDELRQVALVAAQLAVLVVDDVRADVVEEARVVRHDHRRDLGQRALEVFFFFLGGGGEGRGRKKSGKKSESFFRLSSFLCFFSRARARVALLRPLSQSKKLAKSGSPGSSRATRRW